MDRRQQKTRTAILSAFSSLLEQKNINTITVQEIIDKADIGRSTFYAHFETKQDLLKELCEILFHHIIASVSSHTHAHGLYISSDSSESVFCHLLYHLSENDNHILELLSGENSDVFLRYFKSSLNRLVADIYLPPDNHSFPNILKDFFVNHIASSFVEMVLWWIRGGKVQTPEELNGYFCAVIAPFHSS